MTHAGAFEVTHKGLCNFLDHMPRSEADSATVMILVEGACRRNPEHRRMEIGVIAGTCWSPKVFDILLCHFEDATSQHVGDLCLPFECRLSRRAANVHNCRKALFFAILRRATAPCRANRSSPADVCAERFCVRPGPLPFSVNRFQNIGTILPTDTRNRRQCG